MSKFITYDEPAYFNGVIIGNQKTTISVEKLLPVLKEYRSMLGNQVSDSVALDEFMLVHWAYPSNKDGLAST